MRVDKLRPPPADFVLRPAGHDGLGGVLHAGFASDVPLATPDGAIAVGDLRPGDLVLVEGRVAPVLRCTKRRLIRAALDGAPAARAILVRADAFAPGVPSRDIRLAPEQPVAFNGHRAAAARLVNGSTVAVVPDAVTYIALAVAGGGALQAAGLACPVRAVPADPRAAVMLRRLVERGEPGRRLDGWVERVTAETVSGWAVDPAQPGAAVPLEIALDGTPIAWGFAGQRRPDLEAGGIGGGTCAFTIRLDTPPTDSTRWLTIRRATDGVDVPGSPVLLRPAESIAPPRRPTTDQARREHAAALFAQIDRLIQARQTATQRKIAS